MYSKLPQDSHTESFGLLVSLYRLPSHIIRYRQLDVIIFHHIQASDQTKHSIVELVKFWTWGCVNLESSSSSTSHIKLQRRSLAYKLLMLLWLFSTETMKRTFRFHTRVQNKERSDSSQKNPAIQGKKLPISLSLSRRFFNRRRFCLCRIRSS